MKITDLEAILRNYKIPKDEYVLNTSEFPFSECAVVIRKKENRYEVYTSERNIKSRLKFFTSEDAACRYFLSMFDILPDEDQY